MMLRRKKEQNSTLGHLEDNVGRKVAKVKVNTREKWIQPGQHIFFFAGICYL